MSAGLAGFRKRDSTDKHVTLWPVNKFAHVVGCEDLKFLELDYIHSPSQPVSDLTAPRREFVIRSVPASVLRKPDST